MNIRAYLLALITLCKIHSSTKVWGLLLAFLILQIAGANGQNNLNKTLWTVAWSPNGKFLAVGGDQGDLKLFDGKTFELLKTFPVEDVILSRVKWHPTENLLAIITQSETVKAKILDLDSEDWIELQGLQSSFRALDWNHTGELLAVSELEDYVSVFTKGGERVSRFRADTKGVAGLDWHPTKNVIATVGSQIGIYNYLGDTLLSFEPRKEEVFLLCVEWHPSGDFFAVGDYGEIQNSENKWIQFWDIKGKKIHEITGSIAEYRNIRWTADGKKLASASNALKIWSREGLLLAESKSSKDYLWGIDWSPDGKTVVTSSYHGVISVWDDNANLISKIKY